MSFQYFESKNQAKVDTIQWKIGNFSSIVDSQEMINAQVCNFKTEGVGEDGKAHPLDWKLTLNRKTLEDKNLCLHLKLMTEQRDSKLEQRDRDPAAPATAEEFFVRIQAFKGSHTRITLPKDIPDDKPTFSASTLRDGMGCEEFLQLEENNYKQYLDEGGNLMVYVLMKRTEVTGSSPPSVKSLDDFNLESGMRATEAFAQAFQTGTVPLTQKVKIIAMDQKEVKGKWAVLAARSPVFDAIYHSKSIEGTTEVMKMHRMSGKTLEVFYNFFSTGILLPAWKDDEVIAELLNAAAMYKVPDLLEFLDDSLATVCNAATVMRLLSMAQKFSLEKATKGLLEWIKKTDSAEEFLKFCAPMPMPIAAAASTSIRRSDVDEAHSKKRPRRK